MELGGTKSDSASYELVVTRMRFMGAQRKSQGGGAGGVDAASTPLRIVGLSSCVANGHDVGHWLGCKTRTGIHCFTPDVRR